VSDGSVTTTTTQGFLSRLMSSVVGVLVGLAMFFGSFVILWMNEGDIVAEKAAFEEMRKGTVKADANKPDAKHNGKLVHATGKLDSKETIGDAGYIKPGDYLSLERNVEMYQWVEKEKRETSTSGGSKTTKTTYYYEMDWASGREDSSKFKNPTGHTNPPLTISGSSSKASKVSFGKYDGSEVLDRVGASDLNVTAAMLDGKHDLNNGMIYIRAKGNTGGDALGDVRLSYRAVKPDTFSVIAKQDGKSFETYVAKNGKEKFLVENGKKSPQQMIESAKDGAKTFAMIMRVVGFAVMWFGMCIMVGPLTLIMSSVPLVGGFLGGASKFLLYGAFFVVAGVLSTITIVLGMIAHHPIALGVFLATLVGGGLYLYKSRKAKPAVAQHGGQPPQQRAA
jgi:hypothetical protein